LVTRKQYNEGDISTPAVIAADEGEISEPVNIVAAPQNVSDLIFQAPKIGPIELCPDDLLAVYHPQTEGVILVTRKQYDEGDISTPAVIAADEGDISEPVNIIAAPQNVSDLIFQAPKIGPIELCPDDLLAVYHPQTEGIILVTRKQYDEGDISMPAVTTTAPQKTSDLIFQAPKIGPVKLCPDDLLAVYHPPTEGIILVTRKQYDEGDISTPAVVETAPQKTSDLIFQAPKIGPIKLCPDDLLAVYHPQTQGVILVTRKQYDEGDISTPASIATASQKTSDLIFQVPKIGPITLCPDDLLAVYHPPTQGVILVTRSQYDKGDISTPAEITSAPESSAPESSAPQRTSDLIFQAPKIGPVQLSPDDLLAVYHPQSEGVILVTRSQYDTGDISTPAKITSTDSTPQKTSELIFQAPKIGAIELCPEDLLAVYEPASQGVVLVTRRQYDAGELPSGSSGQSFADLIFQPPKVGPVELSEDDLIAVYEPTTQSVQTVTRKEFIQMQ